MLEPHHIRFPPNNIFNVLLLTPLILCDSHDQPVWCVTFSHPKHGTLLASSSFDGRIIIWRENQSTFTRFHDFAQHTASVNLVAWAPHELGCILAGASSDGHISILELKEGQFVPTLVFAHGVGANSVSWAPAVGAGAIASAQQGAQQAPVRRFVSGGSDCLVKIWDYTPEAQQYTCVKELSGHKDWVRDVAWAPTVLSRSYIASASQDKTVKIWTNQGGNVAGDWQCTTLNFEAVAWRVSWSLSGNVLAVSTGDNRVTLWKERLSGGWENVKSIED